MDAISSKIPPLFYHLLRFLFDLPILPFPLPPPVSCAPMAHVSDLPCDGDGVCLACKRSPSEEEELVCSTCGTPWHVPCLSKPPSSLSALPHWQCPDCSPPESGDRPLAPAGALGAPSELIAAVRAIEADGSLTDKEKARRRQELMSGGAARNAAGKKQKSRKNDLLGLLDGSLICCFCRELPERPVTKWIANGKRNCAKCRSAIPSHMASQPRINSALVAAIRVAKTAKTVASSAEFPSKIYHFIHNQDRPDKAFTTERAQRAGKANACSGKIFVSVPPDHFGPILAENDPIRNQGVLVGESWEDRMECRQWGAHLPHIAGIAGQADYGAQSVALSGGYQDDEDHGEWFLYTGSGGRDLSGNKRTNKEQSFDQQFNKMNEALRVSCTKGYPVRVVRDENANNQGEEEVLGALELIGGPDLAQASAPPTSAQPTLTDLFLHSGSLTGPNPQDASHRYHEPQCSLTVSQRELPARGDGSGENLVVKRARVGVIPGWVTEQEVLSATPLGSIEARGNGGRRPVGLGQSHKEKRSSYAPETGVRYDGIYRIEKCWRKVGLQGFKVCRYLFVRCDNEPAPWTRELFLSLNRMAVTNMVCSHSYLNGSDEHGDHPRPLPNVKELKEAIDITERKGSPAWDYFEKDGWRWAKPPPTSRKKVATSNPEDQKRARRAIRRANNLSARQKLLKEFSCLLCQKVMNLPLTTPCAHNFCKPCLESAFAGQTFVRERTHFGGKSLRVQKNVMKCPCCPNDISDFLQNPQVNRELMDVIENLKQQTIENAESSGDEINCTAGKPDPVDEETIIGPRMLETSNEVIQTTKITANKNLTNEENVESSEDEIIGMAGKPDPVDEEIIVGQRMLETSNEAIQTTETAANDCKHLSAHKQNVLMLGSESNGACTQNTKTLHSFNEDNLISGAGSKQSAACKGKKITDGNTVADSNKSDDIGSKNTEIKDRSGKNCDISMKESKRPITCSQKKLASLSKGNQSSKRDSENSNSIDVDCRNCRVQSTDNEQLVNYECKKRGNGKAKRSKKSNEDDRDDGEMANGRGEDLKIPQGKKTVMYKNKTKDMRKERNNGDKLNSENLALLDEGNMDCSTAENKHPKTLTRRPLTRSCSAKMDPLKNKESPDVGRAVNSKGSKGVKRVTNSKGAKGAKKSKIIDSIDVKKVVESKRFDSPGSGNPEMLNGGDKDHQTPKSRQPNTFVRERPLTRSCTSKAKESNPKRSKASGKVQKSSNSLSSPHLLSNDDDF
ncbi:hypothetical protein ACLOJK_002252 [Asimina triloba]